MVARLARLFGDFYIAEEAVQEALLEAVLAWRHTPPDNPAAWLTTAARRNALDLVRSRSRGERRAEAWGQANPQGPGAAAGGPAIIDDPEAAGGSGLGTDDDRVGLLFACCHPALPPEARVALTLRAVVGLTTPQIARGLLIPESTLAQRIVRAKRKIVATGIRLQVPDARDLPSRLDDVLRVIYLAYTEAYVGSSGPGQDRDLGSDTAWLAGQVALALPEQPEAWGLAALLVAQHSRSAARIDPAGNLVPLRAQDRSRWDRAALAEAQGMLARAAALRHTGPYQLQAAIATLHAEAPSWEATDWAQITTLYAALRQVADSPIVRLNEAIALSHVMPGRTQQVLADVDALGDRLAGYHLWHATRAELLRRLGRASEAAEADRRALSLTDNDAERRLLRSRLHRQTLDG